MLEKGGWAAFPVWKLRAHRQVGWALLLPYKVSRSPGCASGLGPAKREVDYFPNRYMRM